nr:hypothetical protein [Verminephrobacter aporrectodeae]
MTAAVRFKPSNKQTENKNIPKNACAPSNNATLRGGNRKDPANIRFSGTMNNKATANRMNEAKNTGTSALTTLPTATELPTMHMASIT